MKTINLLPVVVLLTAISASAQDWARERLEKSPRHIEWVKVKHGDRTVNCSIAYPEVKEKATAVIVIHEIFGLTDWVRGVTDQLAEAGYIAIAPDLLTGAAPGGGGTAELGGGDAVRRGIFGLPPAQITADLDAVADYVSKLPACNGKIVVAGFCWGGTQSFRYATNNKNLKAAFVFYGTAPTDKSELEPNRLPGLWILRRKRCACLLDYSQDKRVDERGGERLTTRLFTKAPGMASCAPEKAPTLTRRIERPAMKRGLGGRNCSREHKGT